MAWLSSKPPTALNASRRISMQAPVTAATLRCAAARPKAPTSSSSAKRNAWRALRSTRIHAGVLHAADRDRAGAGRRRRPPARSACSISACSQRGSIASMSSLRNNRYSPSAASAPRLLSFDQLNGAGIFDDAIGVALQPLLPGRIGVGDIVDADDLEARCSACGRAIDVEAGFDQAAARRSSGMMIETRPVRAAARRRSAIDAGRGRRRARRLRCRAAPSPRGAPRVSRAGVVARRLVSARIERRAPDLVRRLGQPQHEIVVAGARRCRRAAAGARAPARPTAHQARPM